MTTKKEDAKGAPGGPNKGGDGKSATPAAASAASSGGGVKRGARGPDSWAKGPEQRPKWLIDASLQALDTLDVEALALCLTTDVRPLAGAMGYLDWRFCGGLSRMVEAGTITGKAGEKVLMPTLGRIKAQKVFVFGWGDSEKILDGATDKLQWMKQVLEDAKVTKVAIGLPEPARQLMGLVEQHVVEPMGARLAGIFSADTSLTQNSPTVLPQTAPPSSVLPTTVVPKDAPPEPARATAPSGPSKSDEPGRP